MARKPNRFREMILYLPVRAVLGVMQLLGPRVMLKLAGPMARLACLVDLPHRRLASRQVKACLPQLDRRQCRRVVRGAFEGATRMVLESIFRKRVITADNFDRHVALPGLEAWKAALDAAGGCGIMATGHFGNWELGPAIMAHLGYRGVTIVKPFSNRYMNRTLEALRGCDRMETADKKGAFQASVRTLRDGKLLLIAADMYAGRGGLRVHFFGFPASCHRSMALLAVRYRVPLLIGFIHRDEGFFNFTLEMPRVITPDQWADKDDPIFWITEQYNLAIEQTVRRRPEQFFGWLHRRWRGDDVPWKASRQHVDPE